MSRWIAGSQDRSRWPGAGCSPPGAQPEDTTEYLRWYVATYPGQGRRYLGLDKVTGTLEEAQALTPRTPVFLIEDA